VKNFVSMSNKPVRDDHAMAAEVNALGAHVGGARVVRDLE
jgi:preprotein translocase subunit Sss1